MSVNGIHHVSHTRGKVGVCHCLGAVQHGFNSRSGCVQGASMQNFWRAVPPWSSFCLVEQDREQWTDDAVRRSEWPATHSIFDCSNPQQNPEEPPDSCQDPNSSWRKEEDGVPDSSWVWPSIYQRDRKVADKLHRRTQGNSETSQPQQCHCIPCMELRPCHPAMEWDIRALEHEADGTGESRRHCTSEAVLAPWTQNRPGLARWCWADQIQWQTSTSLPLVCDWHNEYHELTWIC